MKVYIWWGQKSHLKVKGHLRSSCMISCKMIPFHTTGFFKHIVSTPSIPTMGGGPLVFEVGYHPHKKIHVIRVAFQDQAMYAHTSFRGKKTCKIGIKGMFLVILTNFGKDMEGQIEKNACKNLYLGSISIPEKYMFRVCFESPFTRMISSLKYKCPHPQGCIQITHKWGLLTWIRWYTINLAMPAFLHSGCTNKKEI